MIKKYSIIILFMLSFSNHIYSAETVSDDKKDGLWNTGKINKLYLKGKNSDYKRGHDALKQAKKYAKKGKEDKAKKRFNDAAKFFTLANKKFPNDPNILNYLGYTLKKVGDFTMAEIYYEQGLAIDPQHIGINEYLGELYVETNRIDKAKERLKVLENCKCKEFDKLQNLISKY